MIDFGRPVFHAVDEQGGITLFADHAVPNRVYYLPDRPRVRLTAGGRPEVALTRYQVDDHLRGIIGGGLLSLTVEIAVEPERLEPIRTRLQRHLDLATPVEFFPVQPDSAACRLLLLDESSEVTPAEPGTSAASPGTPPAETPDQPATGSAAGPVAEPSALVERILGSTVPSLVGTQPATFLAVLSETGTRIVEAALRQGELPVGIVYALQVLGIRPALRGRFTARWDQVYDFLERRFHGGKLLLAVDVGPIIEELERREWIRVEIDQLVPEAERVEAYREVLQHVQEEIIQKFFQPTLGQAPLEEGGDDFTEMLRRGIADVVGVLSFTFSFRKVDRSELKTSTHELAVDAAEYRTMAPQGMLATLLHVPGALRFEPDAHIRSLQPGPSPEMRFDIAAAVDWSQHRVSAIECAAAYGERTENFTLTADAPRRELVFFHQADLGAAMALTWSAHFDPGTDGDGVSFATAGAQAYESRVIRLDPRTLVESIDVRAIAQGIPFDTWPRALMDLRVVAAGRATPLDTTLQLDAAHSEASWRVTLPRGTSYALQRRLRWVGIDGRVVDRDWADIEPGAHVVGPPYLDSLRVSILASARFGDAVDRLVVEMARDEAPGETTSFVLTQAAPEAEWAVPLAPLSGPFDPDAEKARRAWSYRVTVRTPFGEVRTGEWLAGDGARLIAGEGFAMLREVELLLLGPPLESLNAVALKVRFAFEDPDADLFAEHEQLIEAVGKPVRWRYPVADPARRTWTWQLTRILASGEMVREPLEPGRTDERMVVHVLKP